MAAYLFVDGNYLFHLTKSLGKAQEFDLLEKNICTALNLDGFEGKFFYTRPPETADPRGVVGWLRARAWNVQTFLYQYTHQDSLYVNMVADLWNTFTAQPKATMVVVSGSGALTYPLEGVSWRRGAF
ncbi:MAG: NYN domain-containing protein [Desulfobacterales bacterium]|nr:NYN domain-containing protein [Desulfobacterales bacterium]